MTCSKASRVPSRISVARSVVVRVVTAGLALHQQTADQLWGNLLGGAGEEALKKGWKGLDGRGGYWAGAEKCRDCIEVATP